jgi:hypothetical protein
VLSVATKVIIIVIIVIETWGCRRADKVSVGVSDDVLHSLVVGSKVGPLDKLRVILPGLSSRGATIGGTSVLALIGSLWVHLYSYLCAVVL